MGFDGRFALQGVCCGTLCLWKLLGAGEVCFAVGAMGQGEREESRKWRGRKRGGGSDEDQHFVWVVLLSEQNVSEVRPHTNNALRMGGVFVLPP